VHMRQKRLRHGALAAGTAVLSVVALSAPSGAAERQAEGEQPDFSSRPDITDVAPELTTTTTGPVEDGYLLATPAEGAGGPPGEEQPTPVTGAALYDDSGEVVWWAEGEYMNLQPVEYQGEPALIVGAGGMSEDVRWTVLDSSYEEVTSFSMDRYRLDLHDVELSPDGTHALMLGVEVRTMDLSEYGGPEEKEVGGTVIQEVEIATGEVTFEWHSFDHIPIDETQLPFDEERFDYVHGNSLDYTTDGDILMSGRFTSAVYKIDKDTGEIDWRLGGENSDFTFADAAGMPSGQHDARWLGNGMVSVFDNGNAHDPQHSRGAVFALDEEAMEARLVADLQPEEPVFGQSMGSFQILGDGHSLVSYGGTGVVTEFAWDEPVFTATYPEGVASYRTERADWVGQPATQPDVAWTEPDANGSRDLAMSWNGATEVERWRIEAGESEDSLERLETVEKTGFDSYAEVTAPEEADVFRVSALNECGAVLGSRVLTPDTPTVPE
jgi:hypothetical protein